MIALTNKGLFDPRLLADAAVFPTGTFIEVDDLTFELNGMGRKIAQTMATAVDGRVVSMAYVDDAGYELVLARDRPAALGTLAELQQQHPHPYGCLLAAFGGPDHFTPQEMATALVGLTARGIRSASDAADWARIHVRRSTWMVRHRLEATASAPVIWALRGL